MVLVEDIDGDPVYVKGDDDSGFSRNAKFTVRLIKGRVYKLRIQLYYNWAEGETVVMMWLKPCAGAPMLLGVSTQ